MSVLSRRNVTHTPRNTHRATVQVYLPQSALWLWERQVNTFSLLYKQVGPVVALLFSEEEYNTSDSMNKLLVITVLVALLALSAESFRMPRQAEDEQGTLTKITGTIRSYYDNAVNAASGYLENIKGMKLEEKAANLYTDTTEIVTTYAGIAQDQLYHFFSQN